ncbi:Heparan-alpha-glucosaminide N-acetyltransferase [Handroanthus impetiginosus]|uniref:Heparan-alpha-glucosaminide N-acetyltransferase n=1 Tax=Handroanthus impetiginosus TaxID=429701 RepID=A0A2G9IA79_9LAMI|nr:Heparan-alpha-glucosaminide N-acetyltransferase [Handroanthus impetiginosus]
MPFFLFMVGGYFHGVNNLAYGVDMEQIRWMGILQGIVVAHLVAAMCEIWLRNNEKVRSGLSLLKKYQWHWTLALMLTTIYLLLLYGLFVPHWKYQIPYDASSNAWIFAKYFDIVCSLLKVNCGLCGETGPTCNAAGMIDRMILGVQHLHWKPIYARTKPDYSRIPPYAPSWSQAPFDPEGLLSTVMAIVKRSCPMHINKALYSVSYTCVTGGVAGILIATIYLAVDVYGRRRFTMVLEWMGKNALLIYIFLEPAISCLLLHRDFIGDILITAL